MNKLRLILTAIITAFFLLMVSCSPEPIEEPKTNGVENTTPIIENKICTYTEELPYVITEYSETNMQNDFHKYKKTTKVNYEIINVETYIISTEIEPSLLNKWICNN